MTETLISTTYASVATVPFSDDDLAALLTLSRANNARAGLTGLLLFKNGQFMQVLEGPEGAVRSRLAIIGRDLRHSGVWTLASEPIEERRFAEWSMGYRPLKAGTLTGMPGYDGFLESDDGQWVTASRANALLDWFRGR